VTAVAFARDGRLHVVFAGLDALWTVRRRVDLPLGSVLSARAMALAEALAEKPLVRAPGTYLPGVIVAGTYRHVRRGGRPQLWCAHSDEDVLVLELDEAPWERIVLSMADPAAAARELGTARGELRGVSGA
jgi:hypothetical protein